MTDMKQGTDNRLQIAQIVFGLLLASASGLGILAHTFWNVPMSFSAPFVVLPSVAILVGIILFSRRQYGQLAIFADRLMRGAFWGFIATLFYDAVRPLLTWILTFTFNPYKAMPIFGSLITGLPQDDTLAQLVGWGYHFWNGISFGMMFALVFPRGSWIAGFIWAMILQGLMMWAYPWFLQARLDDPGFMVTGIVGHGLWGIVLGLGLKWKYRKANG
jgi:hypothetical protein